MVTKLNEHTTAVACQDVTDDAAVQTQQQHKRAPGGTYTSERTCRSHQPAWVAGQQHAVAHSRKSKRHAHTLKPGRHSLERHSIRRLQGVERQGAGRGRHGVEGEDVVHTAAGVHQRLASVARELDGALLSHHESAANARHRRVVVSHTPPEGARWVLEHVRVQHRVAYRAGAGHVVRHGCVAWGHRAQLTVQVSRRDAHGGCARVHGECEHGQHRCTHSTAPAASTQHAPSALRICVSAGDPIAWNMSFPVYLCRQRAHPHHTVSRRTPKYTKVRHREGSTCTYVMPLVFRFPANMTPMRDVREPPKLALMNRVPGPRRCESASHIGVQ